MGGSAAQSRWPSPEHNSTLGTPKPRGLSEQCPITARLRWCKFYSSLRSYYWQKAHMGTPAIKYCRGVGNLTLRTDFRPGMPIPHCKGSMLQTMPVMQCQSDISARPSRELLDGESNWALLLRGQRPCWRHINLLAKERGQWWGLMSLLQQGIQTEQQQLGTSTAAKHNCTQEREGRDSGWPTFSSLQTTYQNLHVVREAHDTYLTPWRSWGEMTMDLWSLISAVLDTARCKRGAAMSASAEPVGLSPPPAVCLEHPNPPWPAQACFWTHGCLTGLACVLLDKSQYLLKIVSSMHGSQSFLLLFSLITYQQNRHKVFGKDMLWNLDRQCLWKEANNPQSQ